MNVLRQRLVALASRFAISREDAEDVAQETLLRLCTTRSNGTPVRDEQAFACRTAARLAIEQLRKTNRRGARLAQVAQSTRASADSAVSHADVERLYEAIARLPARQAAVITLRKLMELDYSEVAAILGISEDACRSNCRLGLQRLREWVPE